MYQSILVPLDGSDFSAAALPVAAALARRTGATLQLAIVHDPSMYLHFKPGELTTFNKAELDNKCASLRAWVEEQAASISNTGVRAHGTYLEGTIVEAIAEHAELTNANLVVMTTHARDGLDRLRVGSIAASFIAQSPVPVFLVRPSGPEAPSPGHELPTGSLLVPLDGSSFAEAILPVAAEFARALSLSIELISVCASSAIIATRAYLESAVAKLNPAPAIAAKITVLDESAAARALIDYAAQTHPAAIAMATHGRSGFVRLVLGTVTEKVLKGVEQPLLVYRPDEAST